MQEDTVLVVGFYAFLILCAFGVLVFNHIRHQRDGEWHVYKHDKMMRWDGKRWIFREMTEEELMDHEG